MSRVSVVRCPSYERDQVQAAVNQAVALLGGWEAFIKPGDKVLLKPNILVSSPVSAGVTTHPEVMRAAIIGCQQAGAAEVWVGDSPSVGNAVRAADRCGILAVCRETGAQFRPFDKVVERQYPEGLVAKTFLLGEPVTQADKVISMAKLKTHAFMVYTGAVKNLYGTIAGLEKGRLHFSYQTPSQFARLLIDLYHTVQPAFSIIDGIMAMEGNGPQSGHLRSLGAVIAGPDGFAVDMVATGIVGLRPEQVPVLAEAIALGLLPAKAEEIEQLGVPAADLRLSDFKVPAARPTNFPPFMSNFLRTRMTARPEIIVQKCEACGICRTSCPAQAISIEEHQGRRYAVIDRDKCIRCYCCQEVCPHDAVRLRHSFVGRLVRWR